MELLISILIGLMFAAAVYLILSKSLLRIIIGTAILSHGVNLLVLTMGGIKRGNVPILGLKVTASYNDPIPQALILTAIVISFGVTAFFLVLAYRAYQELDSESVSKTRGHEADDE
ncbi:Na+ H+ antiporter subunit C [Listeria fleischmannii 1991]|uniref:Multiple resistance and pH homeostasis protein C n=2 Tax=Listeria fleischmannii TaxID=1069827 RepID=A0A2X3GVY5_9LIST|nr:Na(+)/H(+) antiporter subunit C [Listeria fleischmannii]EMG27940.1 monovalent cation/H+ antiporter subunit C [Listeria fleischmannii subsp. fleischmannii LU2006-1]KMT61330.1 Na+ H+ antiporter subunit C [Listeria fleischmannii 1991]SQC64107.1 Multiple resistance and pH homeostasis protein C [Listeria fleischmannii subsp. fleischmannii]